MCRERKESYSYDNTDPARCFKCQDFLDVLLQRTRVICDLSTSEGHLPTVCVFYRGQREEVLSITTSNSISRVDSLAWHLPGPISKWV